MAGDLGTNEWAILDEGGASDRAAAEGAGRTIHRYGRLRIVAEPGTDAGPTPGAGRAELQGLSELERFGLEALERRGSEAYREGKRNRPRAGRSWDMRDCTTVVPRPETPEAPAADRTPGARTDRAEPAPYVPTSGYLEGSVAVGIVFVDGPTDALKFTNAEKMITVAEVQNGLGWYATANPLANISFTYQIDIASLNLPADPSAPDLEGYWRGPAMQALGYDEWGMGQYVEDLRTRLGTRWTYMAFFTKYPLDWFAYAYLGGPYLVMDYAVDGWGTDNLDRVFAHETGHIFNCPDEYGSSGCSCGGAWGRFGVGNGNCENCAGGGGVSCIMKGNDFTMCDHTKAHIGWSFTTPLFARHSGKVFDVESASTANGAAVHQWNWWGADNQRWKIEALGDGTVRLLAVHSGKALDVDHASTADGARVIQWAWSNSANQRWIIENADYGNDFRLVAKHSGKVLEVAGRSEANGAPLVQREWWGGGSQRWGHRNRALIAKHSGRALTVRGYSTDEGAPIVQWEWWGGDNQLWVLEPVGNGDVMIQSQLSSAVLEVENESTSNGAPLVQRYWTGKDSQRFRTEIVEPGFFRLVNRHSGKVVDVSELSQADGAPVHQWEWLGGQNQRWRF